MDPISTTTAIATVIGYLSKVLGDNKSIQDFFSDFSAATVNWLRPIFLKEDGSAKETLQQLQQNPADELNQRDAQTAIERSARNTPAAETYLAEMIKIIQQKTGTSISANHQQVGNQSSGNIQMADFKAGKNIKIHINRGDEDQTH